MHGILQLLDGTRDTSCAQDRRIIQELLRELARRAGADVTMVVEAFTMGLDENGYSTGYRAELKKLLALTSPATPATDTAPTSAFKTGDRVICPSGKALGQHFATTRGQGRVITVVESGNVYVDWPGTRLYHHPSELTLAEAAPAALPDSITRAIRERGGVSRQDDIDNIGLILGNPVTRAVVFNCDSDGIRRILYEAITNRGSIGSDPSYQMAVFYRDTLDPVEKERAEKRARLEELRREVASLEDALDD